jgi:hypothetical protein
VREIEVAPLERHDFAYPQSQALCDQHHGAAGVTEETEQGPELVVAQNSRLASVAW